MKNKNRYKERSLKNDLDWLDPDQKLRHEKDDYEYRDEPSTLRESLSRGFRSVLAVIICIVIPALWYFDWNASAMADETSDFVTGFFEEGSNLPVAPLPPVPEAGPAETTPDMSLLDYTAALNDQGLLEEFSSPAVQAFYRNGVTINFLLNLRDAGLIEAFSFPAVVAFYQNEVPFDFLSKLKAENLLSDLSFPAVVAFHQNQVTIDYLSRLKEAGFLDDISFPAVVAYFENEVTIDFLNQLEDRGLLEKLSFPAVVDMYRSQ